MLLNCFFLCSLYTHKSKAQEFQLPVEPVNTESKRMETEGHILNLEKYDEGCIISV